MNNNDNNINNFENTEEMNYNFDKGLGSEDNNNHNNNNNDDKKRRDKTKRLPSLGIAAMLIFTSIFGGVVGAAGMKYFDSRGTSQSVQKNTSLNSNVTTTSIPKTSITKVAEEVGPAIVGISTTKSNWIDATNDQSAGSGIIFDANGYIVTNQHVIAGGTKVMVSLPGGKKVVAKVVGQDAKTDIAVLKVEEKNLPTAKFGDSDAMRVGDSVIAIGNPLGEEFAGSVTNGIISAKEREMSLNEKGVSRTYKVMQTNAAINPGNSGGALLNQNGEVIGINTLKISSAEGMGFAIPINEVKTIIKELINTGYIKRPFLGVSTVYLDEESAKQYGIPSGMGVRQVVDGSAAQKAGIVAGEIITEIDGKKITGENDLSNAINKKKTGDTVTLKVSSESGKVRTVKAVLLENKDNQQ